MVSFLRVVTFRCDRAFQHSLTSPFDHFLLFRYIDDQNAAYDANSYYEEYIANNNGYQQYSNENYSYGSQYYGNGYWDNVNNNKNQQQQSYQQYYQQQGQQQNYGDGTNYAMGYQVRAGTVLELGGRRFLIEAPFLVDVSNLRCAPLTFQPCFFAPFSASVVRIMGTGTSTITAIAC